MASDELRSSAVQPSGAADPRPSLRRWAIAPACVCAAVAILVFVWVALARMSYPYDLEWIEGASVDVVQRVLDGEPIYAAPSVEYVPQLYTPLYFWVSALAASATGNGHLPLRLVSFACALGSLALIFTLVRRWTSRPALGLVAAGFYAACFRAAGAWLDVAHVDSLAVVLVLLGLWLTVRAESRRGALVAGAVLGVAFFAKQTTLAVAAATIAGAFAARRPHSVLLAASSALVVLVGSLALDRASDGWFRYYALELPRSHEWSGRWMRAFWTWDLRRHAPVAALVTAAYALFAWRRADRRAALLSLAAIAGGIASAWLGRAHSGGFANVLLPGFAALALGFGLGLDSLLAWASAQRRPIGLAASAVLALIAVSQFALLRYDARALIPSERDTAAGDAWLARIESIEGDVFVRDHGYLSARAGKSAWHHHMAAADVLRGGGEVAGALKAEIDRAIASARFAAVVLDPGPIPERLAEHYVESESPVTDAGALWTRVGMQTRPETLWIRR